MRAAVPNIDAMEQADLMRFWNRHQRGIDSRAMFPDGGKGTKTATADLANYAANKAAAISCRTSGNIQAALVYEGICERIYERLPVWARW
jgi:hypothetical protein